MRIVLFIVGTIAVIYLMVKGFKQVIEESRAHQDDEPLSPHKKLDSDRTQNDPAARQRHQDNEHDTED